MLTPTDKARRDVLSQKGEHCCVFHAIADTHFTGARTAFHGKADRGVLQSEPGCRAGSPNSCMVVTPVLVTTVHRALAANE